MNSLSSIFRLASPLFARSIFRTRPPIKGPPFYQSRPISQSLHKRCPLLGDDHHHPTFSLWHLGPIQHYGLLLVNSEYSFSVCSISGLIHCLWKNIQLVLLCHICHIYCISYLRWYCQTVYNKQYKSKIVSLLLPSLFWSVSECRVIILFTLFRVIL